MKIKFIGQGLQKTSTSVGDVLLKSFLDPEFNKFVCLVAFASEAAVSGISENIQKSKSHIKNFKVFVGIDQKGTLKEALEALLKLNINSSIYHTCSHIIFHPKIFLFEGDKNCRIIVGSSNLTIPGLFQNIEASLLIDFTKPDKEGENLLNQINSYFKLFFSEEDKNLQKLNKILINRLVKAKLIPNEKKRKEVQEKKIDHKLKDSNRKTWEEIKKLFPSISIQRVPKQWKTEAQSKKLSVKKDEEMIEESEKGELLWEKNNLPGSDVQYSPKGTNPTGCLRLTQANWKDKNGKIIDQTTYFRNKLFDNFKWTEERTSPFVEITKVFIDIKILGVDKGLHQLIIRHKPSGVADQGNYTTSISWGVVGDIIKDAKLLGKKLRLYAPPADKKEPLFLEIV